MKVKVLICITLAMVAGCVTASYNPETREAKYTRFGDQQLGGVEIVLGDGSYITFESQKSDARLLNDALRLLERGIAIGRMP